MQAIGWGAEISSWVLDWGIGDCYQIQPDSACLTHSVKNAKEVCTDAVESQYLSDGRVFWRLGASLRYSDQYCPTWLTWELNWAHRPRCELIIWRRIEEEKTSERTRILLRWPLPLRMVCSWRHTGWSWHQQVLCLRGCSVETNTLIH